MNDGTCVKLVSTVANRKLRENLDGTDFIPELLRLLSEIRFSAYPSGENCGVAERAANSIEADTIGVHISSNGSVYFITVEEPAVFDGIDRGGIQRVIFAMGFPRQQICAARDCSELLHGPLVVSGGAVLHFLPDAVPQALRWLPRLPSVLGTGQEKVACRLT